MGGRPGRRERRGRDSPTRSGVVRDRGRRVLMVRRWSRAGRPGPVLRRGHRLLPGATLRRPALVGSRTDLTDLPAGEPVPCRPAPEHQDGRCHQCPGDTPGQGRREQDRDRQDTERHPGGPAALQRVDPEDPGGRRTRGGDHQTHPHRRERLTDAQPEPRTGRRGHQLHDLLVHLDRLQAGDGVEDREHQQHRPADHEPAGHGQLARACGLAGVTHGAIEPTQAPPGLIRG